MAVKIKLARPRFSSGARRPLTRKRVLQVTGVAVGIVLLFCFAVFGFYYNKYKHIVDERLQKPLFTNTAKIYAAPREVRPGQKLSAAFLGKELHEAGYSATGQDPVSPMGTYSLTRNSISVHPGPQSYHAPDGATISFSKGLVSQITGDNGQPLAAYEMEPLLITGLSDQTRTKRRLVTYDELPLNLISAVTSIEDRRFFQHDGVDYTRVAGAALADLRSHRYREGFSTLTMQLAKDVFLTPQKTIRRKLIQVLITFQLEHRFTKKQIFQMYANEIYLGQRGSFAVNGFGEAAEMFFGKDVRQLSLPECALLAGMIQSPSRLNPYQHPARAVERRNVVLDAMVETGDITKAQAEEAKAAPLKLAPQSFEADQAPYFVDLVRDQLARKLGDNDYNREGLRIYTSLDPELQNAASEAVQQGLKLVDARVLKMHMRHRKKGDKTPMGPITYPQVALVALNPHTGQVLALVGGRNYGMSQLDHAIAHRPTGSIFKPFVFAAAFNTSLAGTPLNNADGSPAGIFTPVTMLSNEQTTFTFNDQEYTPRNFENEYSDQVTARKALFRSLNNPTITLAQMVGFNNVASLAREAGITSARGTPSVAIGAYGATPLEMAGAYTVFANDGIKIDPWMLASVRSAKGDPISDYAPVSKPVLDPRVAFLTLSLMEDVLNNRHGTGASVRNMGFRAPAAGKTGTSHDAWFAGFTSNLLCVVWVGNDDYTDIKMQGAQAAAPIWADFMKRAVKLPQYSDTKDFVPPPGVIEVNLDNATNLLADASCPDDYTAAFLDGTQPTETCDHSNGNQRNLFQKMFGFGQRSVGPAPQAPPPVPAQPVNPPANASPSAASNNNPEQQTPPPPKKKKRGFFSRLFGIGSSSDDDSKQKQDQNQQQNPQ